MEELSNYWTPKQGRLQWPTRMRAMSFSKVLKLYRSCMNIALTERRTPVQLERSFIISPATMFMSPGPILERDRNQIDIKWCISSTRSKKVRLILMHEFQYEENLKKIPVFRTESKIFVFRNFTEMTDAYSHN